MWAIAVLTLAGWNATTPAMGYTLFKKGPRSDQQCKKLVTRKQPTDVDGARKLARELATQCPASSNAQMLAAAILVSIDRRVEAIPLLAHALEIDADWSPENRRTASLILEGYRKGSAKASGGPPEEQAAVSLAVGAGGAPEPATPTEQAAHAVMALPAGIGFPVYGATPGYTLAWAWNAFMVDVASYGLSSAFGTPTLPENNLLWQVLTQPSPSYTGPRQDRPKWTLPIKPVEPRPAAPQPMGAGTNDRETIYRQCLGAAQAKADAKFADLRVLNRSKWQFCQTKPPKERAPCFDPWFAKMLERSDDISRELDFERANCGGISTGRPSVGGTTIGAATAVRPRCDSQTDCASCTAMEACGWCASTRKCMTGTAERGVDCPSSWRPFPESCNDPCVAHDGCRACNATESCGFCQSNRSCYLGMMPGPITGKCGGNDWTPTVDMCR